MANKTNQLTINYSSICLNEEFLLIVRHPVEKLIWSYIFPLQLAFGVFGNALTLTVLLSRKMRQSTANTFLAAMAMTDILTLFMLTLRCLSSYDVFARNSNFYTFYNEQKNRIMALTNWFSATSIWFVLAVTVERLIAIRFPFQAKFWLTRRRIVAAILLISIFAFIITFHHYFTFEIRRLVLCNSQQLFYSIYAITHPKIKLKQSVLLRDYIYYGTLIDVLLVIVGPTVILISLSFALVYSLKCQKEYFTFKNHKEDQCTFGDSRTSKERKITITVVVIVLAFIVTYTPSAAVYAWHMAKNFAYVMPAQFYYTAWVSNCLAVTGKVLNFFLFCLSSSTFRQELVNIMGARKRKLSYCIGVSKKRRSSETADTLILMTTSALTVHQNVVVHFMRKKSGSLGSALHTVPLNAQKRLAKAKRAASSELIQYYPTSNCDEAAV